MTLFQLLCETISSNDGAQARELSAKAELMFEAFLLLCQDIPEIGLQAAYLTDPNAPDSCKECAYGFVLVSFLVSVLTALTKGSVRTFAAYQKYKNVSAEIAGENSTRELSTRTAQADSNNVMADSQGDSSEKLVVSNDNIFDEEQSAEIEA